MHDIPKETPIAPRVSRSVGVDSVDTLMRVILHVNSGALELGVLRDLLVVQVVYLTLGCDVPDLQSCRVMDVVQAVVAQRTVHTGTRHAGDLGVWNITVFSRDGLDGVEGIQV